MPACPSQIEARHLKAGFEGALGEAQKSVKAGKRFMPKEFRQGHH
jgi:hypothetical protein